MPNGKQKISMISKNQIKFIHSLEQKKIRDREGLFIAEGPKTVADLMSIYEPVELYATEEWFDKRPTIKQHCTQITEDELHKISFLKHPQQVLGVFPIPHNEIDYNICQNELCLALDGVQDPGNLGTIIRIADWFGISTIFCGEGTADAFNPKVVQATMGSIARVKIVNVNLCELLDKLPNSIPTYATSLNGRNIYDQQLSTNGLIIMGNEGNGISSEVMSKVNHTILIPNYSQANGIDSLNVAIATALTCAEFRRNK